MRDLAAYLPSVADFPRPGVTFRDICPLLADADAMSSALAQMQALIQGWQIDCLAGIESRGLIFGAALATRMHLGLIPIRKPGKLPPPTVRAAYELEYGQDSLEMQRSAIHPGNRVLLIDDVIATGGTLLAAARLVSELRGRTAGVVALLSLEGLGGRARLANAGLEVRSVLSA
jgi:adenine phosphoribosyltransferase